MKKKVPTEDRLIVALDVPNASQALKHVRNLKSVVKTFKVGLELFTAEGPDIVRKINRMGCRVFLDLKFFDIPNTMAGAVRSASTCKPFLLNLHGLAGPEAMRECAKALKKIKGRPKLLAVTLLTSFSAAELKRVGVATPIDKSVSKLCKLSIESGLDGVVASPNEAAMLRKKYGNGFLIVTPGVRPKWSAKNDQKRVATPCDAIMNGADYIVVGRPILGASRPIDAARRIIAEMEEAK